MRGPISLGSILIGARHGRHDGVFALYHDRAFIPLKLVAEGEITVIASLPYLRPSPMHGPKFDIAGRGLADPTRAHANGEPRRGVAQRARS